MTKKKMNLYIVYGTQTDGTYLSSYSSFVIVAALSEEAARRKAKESYIILPIDQVSLIGTTDSFNNETIIEEAITRDY